MAACLPPVPPEVTLERAEFRGRGWTPAFHQQHLPPACLTPLPGPLASPAPAAAVAAVAVTTLVFGVWSRAQALYVMVLWAEGERRCLRGQKSTLIFSLSVRSLALTITKLLRWRFPLTRPAWGPRHTAVGNHF